MAAEIKTLDPGAESNPLLFPTPDVVAKQHNWQYLSTDVEKTLNTLYTDLTGA